MVTEGKILNRNTRQKQTSTPLRSKKRASSNPDQDGSRKRREVAQLEENQLPEITTSSQVDTDLIEDLLPPVATVTDRQRRFIERSQGVMEMRWTTSRRDDGSHSDDDEDRSGDDDDEDEDEDGKDKDGDEDGDEHGDRDEHEHEDEDEHEPSFYDTEIPGISDWDLLGEDFEREAAALGLYSFYELRTQLTTL